MDSLELSNSFLFTVEEDTWDQLYCAFLLWRQLPLTVIIFLIRFLILAQMYSVSQTWRWSAWIPLTLAGVSFVMILFTYHPPPRVNSLDYNRTQLLGRVDYLGGLLSMSGIALFM